MGVTAVLKRLRSWAAVPVVLAVFTLGCPRVLVPDLSPDPSVTPPEPCPGNERTDVARIASSGKVDVLVVVDTDGASSLVLDVASVRLLRLVKALMDGDAPQDFHLAVAPTNGRGTLAPVPSVEEPLLTACRGDFNPDAGFASRRTDAGVAGVVMDGGVFIPDDTGCESCTRYLSRSQCRCGLVSSFGAGAFPPCANLAEPAARLFDNVRPTPEEARSSMGVLETVYATLGLVPACGEIGFRVDPPPSNIGFYRDEAALLVIIISGREEMLPGQPMEQGMAAYRETLRQVRSLKGPGREEDVKIAAITGICRGSAGCGDWPALLAAAGGQEALPEDLCVGLRAGIPPPSCTNNQSDLYTVLQNPAAALLASPNLPGCDVCRGNCPTPKVVETARFLVTLACDVGGVVYNICAPDWSSVITGSLEDFLKPRRVLVPLTEDAVVDSLRAVSVTADGVELTAAITESDSRHVVVEPVIPGSTLRVTYTLARSGPPQCCQQTGGCGEGFFCNATDAEQGFCQQAHCGGGLGCPEGSGACDIANLTCVPLNRCVRDEHCPAGYLCNCNTSTCELDARFSCDE